MVLGQLGERPKQGGRIGAAGERDDQASARERSVPPQKALDVVDEKMAQSSVREVGATRGGSPKGNGSGEGT